MQKKLTPYEAYKEVDLPWIDKIPSHWKLTRNKNTMDFKKELVGNEHGGFTLLSLTLKGIIARDMVNPKGKFPGDFSTYQVVEIDNLVFCLFDIDETPRTVGLSLTKGMITGAYSVFEVKKDVNPKFLYFYYLALDQNKLLKPLYKGLRKTINTDVFLRTKLPLPPKREQEKIVKYLEHNLEQIDKFVKVKKKLILVLKEQKQAIINYAVTKGISEKTILKVSSISWVEEIPQHWEFRALKRLTSAKMTDGPHETPEFIETGIPFVSVEAVYDGKINLQKMRGYISKKDHQKYCEKVRPQKNDIFIVKSGSTTGKSCIVDIEEEFSIWSPLALVRSSNENDPRFLFYAINSTYFQEQVQDKWSFGTQPNIGMGILQNLFVARPPIAEQKEIVKFIEKETGVIDKAIKDTLREIELINEYKKSLVFEVVTGKKDIRHIKIDSTLKLDENIIESDIENVFEEELEVL